MDSEVKLLEKRWHESRTFEDEQRFLIAAVESGFLSKERVAFAGALGHAVSQVLLPPMTPLPEHYRSKIEPGSRLLSHSEAVTFALECAMRAMPAWTAVRPQDLRPAKAIAATQDWLSGNATLEAVAGAARGADDAGVETDSPDLVPGNLLLTAGLSAAVAASHSAHAAEYAAKVAAGLDPGLGDVEECVGWTAKFASDAAINRDQERNWQIERLIEYLLKRTDTRGEAHAPAPL